jgi:cell division protein FtsB
MWTRHRRKSNRGRLILPVLSIGFLGYFGFHALNGDSGLYAKYRLKARIAELNNELTDIQAKHDALERRVQLMHDGTLEKDILDEQARKNLNLAQSDEIIIMRGPKNRN